MMTYEELRKRFPNAVESFLRRNADDYRPGLRAAPQKPVERLPLENDREPETPD